MVYALKHSQLSSRRDLILPNDCDLLAFTNLDGDEQTKIRYRRNTLANATPQGRELTRFWDELLGIDSTDLANIVAGYSAEPVGLVKLTANGEPIYQRTVWSLPFQVFPTDLVPLAAIIYSSLRVLVLTDDPADEFILTSKTLFLSKQPRQKLRGMDGLLDFGGRKIRVVQGFMTPVRLDEE
jgi:hypothetical protein